MKSVEQETLSQLFQVSVFSAIDPFPRALIKAKEKRSSWERFLEGGGGGWRFQIFFFFFESLKIKSEMKLGKKVQKNPKLNNCFATQILICSKSQGIDGHKWNDVPSLSFYEFLMFIFILNFYR